MKTIGYYKNEETLHGSSISLYVYRYILILEDLENTFDDLNSLSMNKLSHVNINDVIGIYNTKNLYFIQDGKNYFDKDKTLEENIKEFIKCFPIPKSNIAIKYKDGSIDLINYYKDFISIPGIISIIKPNVISRIGTFHDENEFIRYFRSPEKHRKLLDFDYIKDFKPGFDELDFDLLNKINLENLIAIGLYDFETEAFYRWDVLSSNPIKKPEEIKEKISDIIKQRKNASYLILLKYNDSSFDSLNINKYIPEEISTFNIYKR